MNMPQPDTRGHYVWNLGHAHEGEPRRCVVREVYDDGHLLVGFVDDCYGHLLNVGVIDVHDFVEDAA